MLKSVTNDNKQEIKTEIPHSTPDTTQQSHSVQTNLVIKNIVRSRDTLIIDRKSAVFRQPDSLDHYRIACVSLVPCTINKQTF